MDILLTKGYHATIDDEDAELVCRFKWFAHVNKRKHSDPMVYASRNVGRNAKRTKIRMFMHNLIIGHPRLVDHKDGNGLNNRRANLRIATKQQNRANAPKRMNSASPYRCVRKNKSLNRPWMVSINQNGKSVMRESFREECDAATAYNFQAEILYGEFAYYNLPKEVSK